MIDIINDPKIIYLKRLESKYLEVIGFLMELYQYIDTEGDINPPGVNYDEKIKNLSKCIDIKNDKCEKLLDILEKYKIVIKANDFYQIGLILRCQNRATPYITTGGDSPGENSSILATSEKLPAPPVSTKNETKLTEIDEKVVKKATKRSKIDKNESILIEFDQKVDKNDEKQNSDFLIKASSGTRLLDEDKESREKDKEKDTRDLDSRANSVPKKIEGDKKITDLKKVVDQYFLEKYRVVTESEFNYNTKDAVLLTNFIKRRLKKSDYDSTYNDLINSIDKAFSLYKTKKYPFGNAPPTLATIISNINILQVKEKTFGSNWDEWTEDKQQEFSREFGAKFG